MTRKTEDFEMTTLPAVSETGASGLQRYIQMIKAMPYLTEDEEYRLAKELKDQKSRKAAEILVSSHLRLVVKVAYDFRHYGLPLADLISEGNIGLMTAVKKFDPDKGFRLTTYAMWWIKAMIQEYILSSWSMVKIGSANVQKKLFFGLKRAKEKLGVYDDRDLTPAKVAEIAQDLNVPEQAVYDMNMRLGGDFSLNQTTGDDDKTTHLDYLISAETPQDDAFEEKEMKQNQRALLEKGLGLLKERERDILLARHQYAEKTLRDLAIEFGISAERVRQIEESAMKKLKTFISDMQNPIRSIQNPKKLHDRKTKKL